MNQARERASHQASGVATMSSENVLKFPPGFLWGAATAPTQVEGYIENEWTNFIALDGGD